MKAGILKNHAEVWGPEADSKQTKIRRYRRMDLFKSNGEKRCEWHCQALVNAVSSFRVHMLSAAYDQDIGFEKRLSRPGPKKWFRRACLSIFRAEEVFSK